MAGIDTEGQVAHPTSKPQRNPSFSEAPPILLLALLWLWWKSTAVREVVGHLPSSQHSPRCPVESMLDSRPAQRRLAVSQVC